MILPRLLHNNVCVIVAYGHSTGCPQIMCLLFVNGKLQEMQKRLYGGPYLLFVFFTNKTVYLHFPNMAANFICVNSNTYFLLGLSIAHMFLMRYCISPVIQKVWNYAIFTYNKKLASKFTPHISCFLKWKYLLTTHSFFHTQTAFSFRNFVLLIVVMVVCLSSSWHKTLILLNYVKLQMHGVNHFVTITARSIICCSRSKLLWETNGRTVSQQDSSILNLTRTFAIWFLENS